MLKSVELRPRDLTPRKLKPGAVSEIVSQLLRAERRKKIAVDFAHHPTLIQ